MRLARCWGVYRSRGPNLPAYLSRAQTLRRLNRGEALFMELGTAGARLYWFERPLAFVSADLIHRLTSGARPSVHLVEARDSLFGLVGNSQTYRAARGGRH